MHDSAIGVLDRGPDLLQLLSELAEREQRQSAADRLARRLNGESLTFFARDHELDVLLPAPGLPQVIQGAAKWQAFLDRCARDGACADELPSADGTLQQAHGCAVAGGSAAVLLGPHGDAATLEKLRPILPLLGALFRAERKVASEAVRLRSAAESVARANVLTGALQQMHEQLEAALAEAEVARGMAKDRADEAEELASELRAQAEELQDQAAELELLNDELSARSSEAERAQSAADAANRAKSDFLASMSHELRTPINAVIGYTELLSMGIGGKVTDEQRGHLERIRASSSHLLTLVNDVLDLAKVEAGQMSVERGQEMVEEVLAEALALIEMQATDAEISLNVEGDESGILYAGDKDRVRQILINLLSNAVKFTPRGGAITVRAACVEEPEEGAELIGDGSWVRISVEDTGIGLDSEELPKIFQAFVQAESGTTRTKGGTGLGLTISRQLARLMGGDLTVQSEKGRGSCFSLWLPSDESPVEKEIPTEVIETPNADEEHFDRLREVGTKLQAGIGSVVGSFVYRVRADPLLAEAGGVSESELMERMPIFVADLAGLLITLGRAGGDPSRSWRGREIQRLLAEEHGADRARLGWTNETLSREFSILREEIVRLMREGADASTERSDDGTVEVIDRLLRQAEVASLRSLGAASVTVPS